MNVQQMKKCDGIGNKCRAVDIIKINERCCRHPWMLEKIP